MIKFLKSLFFKPKPRLYPVPGEKKRRIEYTQSKDVVLFVLLIILITVMSCNPRPTVKQILDKDFDRLMKKAYHFVKLKNYDSAKFYQGQVEYNYQLRYEILNK